MTKTVDSPQKMLYNIIINKEQGILKMELKITQNIKPEDLLQGISWHGETNHDNEAVEKLKELNEFVSDLVAKIFFFQLQMEQVATNQNNLSAKELSEEAKKLLVNVAQMTMEEESWEAFEKIEKERKSIAEYSAKNIAQFKTWSSIEVNILREIWKELKKTGYKDVVLNLSGLKERIGGDVDNETWESILETLPKKITSLTYWKNWTYSMKGVSPFGSATVDPEADMISIGVAGEMLSYSNGVVEKTIALDFLNEVMASI